MEIDTVQQISPEHNAGVGVKVYKRNGMFKLEAFYPSFETSRIVRRDYPEEGMNSALVANQLRMVIASIDVRISELQSQRVRIKKELDKIEAESTKQTLFD